jgi:CxxC-x17-CxxC domain-containing protein
MSFQEKTIACSDCAATFIHSAEEQEQFQVRGYTNEPKRCPTCRQARKAQAGNTGSYGNGTVRQMFPVKCADCGKDAQVPFEPRGDRPVYCSDCFRKVKPVNTMPVSS